MSLAHATGSHFLPRPGDWQRHNRPQSRKRPAALLPSTLGYSAIPILNKSIKQLEIESHINFSLNEHLLYSRLISRLIRARNLQEHEKMHFMIAVVILTATWSQPVADLYFDNESRVYMETSKSRLSAIIFISTQYKTWLWSDMRRKWGNFIAMKKKT